ncbi:MAG: hypothetical protein JWN44_1232 [Myxococcales bacterium]|nr:hypothetical protein [Myxococcales bacterium]
MKRDRSLVILAAVAALLSAFIWWDRQKPTTDERQRDRDHLLPGFARATATEIAIERKGAVTRLRHEANWWIEGPPRRRADDDNVEALLAVLEFGRVERRIGHPDAATLTKLGLDHPRAIVKVAGHTLRLGGDDPSRGVYLVRDDEPDALVVERRLAETADVDPRLWISMRPTLTDPSEAKQLATDDWALERKGGWRITRPVVTRAADAKVDALVQALQRVRAQRLDDPCAADGGIHFSIDGAAQALVRGPLVLRGDGACLQFRPTDLNLLSTPAATYYERRLFPLRLDDVVAADLGPLSLRREAGVWRITAPLAAAGPASDEAVRAALEPLLVAEARSFSAAPPAAGATRLRVATRDDDIIVAVDGNRARRAGETVTLDLATAPAITLDATRLRAAAADLGATP